MPEVLQQNNQLQVAGKRFFLLSVFVLSNLIHIPPHQPISLFSHNGLMPHSHPSSPKINHFSSLHVSRHETLTKITLGEVAVL